MVSWMVGSAVQFGRLAIAAAVAVMVFGIISLRDASVDAYPQFTPPTVQIQTEALGLSAAEVEQLITVPLEQDLLNGIPWLDTITSESMTGLSAIDLVFEPGTDLLRARQVTQERLSQAHALPAVGSPPVMIQPLSSTSRVMTISLSSRSLSLVDMSVLARWQIRPKLMGVPGVANVAIWGQRDRQLQVLVDPDRLTKKGVSLNKVVETTGNALWVSPLTFVEASTPGTGGFVDTPNQRFGVQHVFPITTAAQLSSLTIQDSGGRTLRLSDVARVVEDHQPLIGDAAQGASDALVLVVQKFPGTGTMEVTKAVEDALGALRPGLAGVDINSQIFRPARFLESALGNVALGAGIGLLLVALLFGLVFGTWRAALVALVTVPLCVIAAAYVLSLRGATFSAVVLTGLVAALSVVIHDAVLSVETVRWRLGEGSSAQSKVAHVVAATAQTRAPLAYATVVIALAVVPALLLTGTADAFADPLVVSYLLAVAASLVVSLTVAPAMAVWLLSPERRAATSSLTVRQRRLAGVRDTALTTVSGFISRPARTVAVGCVLAAAAVTLALQADATSMLPGLQDRDLLIKVGTMPGTSLTETNRITAAASQELRALDGVEAVGVQTGRAVTSDQVANVNAAQIWVNVEPSADLAATTRTIGRVMDGYPGVGHELSTYAGERLAAAQAGPKQPIVVRVYGQEVPVLRAQAAEVSRVLSSIDGIRNARPQTVIEEPTLQVEVDLAKAQRYGIRPGDVRRAAATLLSGLPVGSLYEQQKIFDVVVWSNETARHSLAKVENLPIDTPAGGHVALGDIASVRIAPFPTVIRHQDVSRTLDVTAEVSGRDLAAVQDEVRSRIQAMSFPLEYHAEVAPAASQIAEPTRTTLAYLLAAALGILLVLQAAAASWRLGTALLLTLPLAAVGGLAVAPLVGGIATVGGLVGLVAVLALAVRCNVLLVRGFQEERAQGGAADPELMLRAVRRQAPTVLLTAATTAAALVPFAVMGTIPGVEILHPMAAVVLGGLVTSTAVTLLVVPPLVLRLAPAPKPAPTPMPSPPSQAQPAPAGAAPGR